MRTYEVLFILSPQTPEDESTSLITEFRGVAERAGAKLLKEEAWGRRRLAYPIAKSNEGIYHLFVFDSDGGTLNELDRRMKNSDRVIRHMIARTDEGLKRAAKLAKRNPKKERRPPSSPPVSVGVTQPVEASAAPASAPEAGLAERPAGTE